MDSQDRLIALDDTMDSETLQHYGVKGMKWGVHRARKKISKATTREDLDKATSSLKKHRDKTSAAIEKLEKKNVKDIAVYEKRVKRDAEKSAKLERKAAKKKRKAAGHFITNGRSKELLYEAQKLDAKISTLDARVKKAEVKVKKNQIMMDAFNRGLKDIDAALVEAGKKYTNLPTAAEVDNKKKS